MKNRASKKKYEIISVLLCVCLVLFLIEGCGMGSSGGGAGGDTTKVSISLNIPAEASAASSNLYALAVPADVSSATDAAPSYLYAQAVPLDVSSIKITISADQMTTITDTFNVLPDENVLPDGIIERIYNVPSGPGRTIIAEAYDVEGVPSYSAEVTRDLDGVDTEIDLNMEAL